MKSKKRILISLVVLAAVAIIFSLYHPVPESCFVTINDSYINTERAQEVIMELSSPRYNGRLAGTEGNVKTVEFIVNQFEEIGLAKAKGMETYTQEFEHLLVVNNKKPSLKIKDKQGNVKTEFNYLTDYMVRYGWPFTKINGIVNSSTVYVRDDNELLSKAKDFDDKIVLLDFDVIKPYTQSFFGLYELFEKVIGLNPNIKAIIINCDFRREGYYPVSPSMYLYNEKNGNFNENGPMLLFCRDETFIALREASNTNELVEIELNFELTNVKSSNVLGIIEGSDAELKNEYVIIGAHLDHVGDNKDGTYNPGALDNASGIAGLLEVARSINAQDVKPKKSILFIAFNAEEESLYGSRYYVNNPVYPLQQSVMINLDCLGSKNSPTLSIAISGEVSSDLSEEFCNYAKGFSIKASPSHSIGSDHAPFTKAGVPAVFLIHPEKVPLMHTVNDTFENSIDIERLRDAVRVVLYYLDQNAY